MGGSILVEDVVAGRPGAWQHLFGAYATFVGRLVRRSRSMGSFARSGDACRDVMARVFERLRRDDFRALRLYLSWQRSNATRTFDDWLTVVTSNVVRDYVSQRLGTGGARAALECFAEELPDDSPDLLVLPHATTRETARELLQYAREHLPPGQVVCLEAWLEGSEFAEIALRAGFTDARAAEHAVRAALARLRRRVR